MDKIVIWGATGQAIVLEELLSYYPIEIMAFFENNESLKSIIVDVPIYYGISGFNYWLNNFKKSEDCYFLAAIGGGNGKSRYQIYNLFKHNGLKPYTAIHPSSTIAKNVEIGDGCQILAGSVLSARVTVEENCIINTSSSIDHETRIGKNSHIGPGAKLAGCCDIEENVFVGTNATLLPRIKIGKNSVIGAGAVVTKDVKSNTVVVGNPARVL